MSRSLSYGPEPLLWKMQGSRSLRIRTCSTDCSISLLSHTNMRTLLSLVIKPQSLAFLDRRHCTVIWCCDHVFNRAWAAVATAVAALSLGWLHTGYEPPAPNLTLLNPLCDFFDVVSAFLFWLSVCLTELQAALVRLPVVVVDFLSWRIRGSQPTGVAAYVTYGIPSMASLVVSGTAPPAIACAENVLVWQPRLPVLQNHMLQKRMRCPDLLNRKGSDLALTGPPLHGAKSSKSRCRAGACHEEIKTV